MPIPSYGVLKGQVLETKPDPASDKSPHFYIHVLAGGTHFSIPTNVRSVAKGFDSRLLFLQDKNFTHPILAPLQALADGFHALPSQPGGVALDYIRANLFDRTQMTPLDSDLPDTENDLYGQIGLYTERARQDATARIYAFGSRWPQSNAVNKTFHFQPDNGVHDTHMNQGSLDKQYTKDDGVWQDGGLLINFPSQNQWIAMFFAFASQAWHTDDQTGHAIVVVEGPTPGNQPRPEEPDFSVRIIAALVNPIGPAPEHETVTLLNTTPNPIDVSGWQIADRLKNKCTISGTIASGAAQMFPLPQNVQLGNKGGIITLMDANGLKIDGVQYTQDQAREGWTVVF
ncbi:MAG: DUF2278 family protein [Chloroflexi bacterium]|nr:DUF2278 family protein [Chloroflexota bacterium]